MRYFDELVFDGQLHRGEARSRVFVDAAGEVRGFIGVWPRPMLLQGRSIEAAAAGSLMVERPEQHPTAGARLLRAFLSGPQDLSFSETSNDISQRMWQKAGGERLTATSVDWLRILRPAGLATHMAGTAFAPARLAEPAGEDRRPCRPGAQQTPALRPSPRAAMSPTRTPPPVRSPT